MPTKAPRPRRGPHDLPVPTSRAADRGRPPRSAWRRRVAGVLVVAVVAIASTGCITSATVDTGVLTIVGSAGADTITLRLRSGDPTTLEVDDAADPSVEYAFDRSTFTSIVVDGLEGDDIITLDTANGLFTDTEVTTVLGGIGNDTLVGSAASERLEGGPGADTIDGNTGADVVLGGDDADRFPWDPGDGSDDIDGGNGADELIFNTSAASEVVTLADVGGHVRLTRNVGVVTMDLDAVERVALRTLGGADIMTIGDLTGTDLSTLDIDLADSGGFDDGQVDEVRVPAPAVIGRDGDAAVATGFGAPTRVRNGSANDRLRVQGTAGTDLLQIDGSAAAETVTVGESASEVLVQGMTPGLAVSATAVEQLDIDLGGGDDRLTTSGNLAAVVTLDVDGGDGRDTIAGGNGADVLDGGPDADVLDGNQGADQLRGGDGSDVFAWDPGDANDQVLGGAGTDRLVFTGSGAAEAIGVADVGGLVRVTRNVASVALDLDGVEVVEIRPVSGSDVVTVQDVTATDLTSVEVDLAATGGVITDGEADAVSVNGTGGVDTVAVIGIGSGVEAVGLASLVRIVRADPGLDTLTVDGLGGADVLTASPAARALIGVVLVP